LPGSVGDKIRHVIRRWEQFEAIIATLPSRDAELRAAFIGAFEGPVARETRFLHGETIGELLDRTLPALQRLLAGQAAAGVAEAVAVAAMAVGHRQQLQAGTCRAAQPAY
jgi:broad specificity phosphatase PhoE